MTFSIVWMVVQCVACVALSLVLVTSLLEKENTNERDMRANVLFIEKKR